MNRFLPVLLITSVLLATLGFTGGSSVREKTLVKPDLPVGKWRVEFANGVIETCEVNHDGEASVTEPARSSPGMAEPQGRSAVITYSDDRVERWTKVGERYLVEHWFPGSRIPTVDPVLGIAERAR